jgi:hypothetical protein
VAYSHPWPAWATTFWHPEPPVFTRQSEWVMADEKALSWSWSQDTRQEEELQRAVASTWCLRG